MAPLRLSNGVDSITERYWQADREGVDHLGDIDRAELFVDYLGLSDVQLVTAAERMSADGKYELAASLLRSSTA